MLRRRHRRLVLALGCAGMLASGALAVAGLDAGLLHLAPALVLLAPLLAGRYVGERRLAALSAAWSARARRPAARLRPGGPRPPRTVARGGRLIARALAERGPPVPLPVLA